MTLRLNATTENVFIHLHSLCRATMYAAMLIFNYYLSPIPSHPISVFVRTFDKPLYC